MLASLRPVDGHMQVGGPTPLSAAIGTQDLRTNPDHGKWCGEEQLVGRRSSAASIVLAGVDDRHDKRMVEGALGR
jgi:hypothetical protein